MATQYVRYRLSDGLILAGGFAYQIPAAGEAVLEVADGIDTNAITMRVDLGTHTLRLATAPELELQVTAQLTAQAQSDSRRVDMATTIAFVIARVNPAAWAAMTLAQKRAAVLTGCDQWRDLRAAINSLI